MSNHINDAIIAEATALYDAELNVFPIRFADKEPYGSTSLLTTTRLHRPSIEQLFTDSNIGVMTGRLSHNLVVIDNDSDDAFAFSEEHLRKRGISAWVRMGVRGGQHWVLCAEGEVMNANMDGLQVLGNRQLTVAPPSVHPDGVFYHWTQRDGERPPVVSINQLDFLGVRLVGMEKRNFKRDKTTLPPVAHRVLVEGDITAYKSNSEAEFAACLSLISVGMADAMIRMVFAQFAPPHYAKRRGRSFNKHTLEAAHAWLAEQREMESSRGKEYDQPHSSQFIAYADARPWPGRTGITDKAVYQALCQRMRMDCGSRIFRASVRELSELANIGTQAVQASLGRLRKTEHVKYESKDSASGACLYSLVVPKDMPVITTVGSAYTPVGDSVVTAAILDDAFHTRGLGKSAYSIWRLLTTHRNPMSARHIAEVTGRTVSTVNANLAKLETHEMARKVSAGTSAARWEGCEVSSDQLQKTASLLGTDGKTAKRKALHIDERQKHASHVLMEQKRRFFAAKRPL